MKFRASLGHILKSLCSNEFEKSRKISRYDLPKLNQNLDNYNRSVVMKMCQ